MRSKLTADLKGRSKSLLAQPLLAGLLILLIVSTTSHFAHADHPSPSPHATVLRDFDIELNTAGLGNYLRQLHPNEQQISQTRRLIKQLGDRRFADRELAMKQLIAMPIPPTEALLAALQHDDPEIRWRAKKILAVGKPQQLVIMHAVFKAVEQERVHGLITELLRAIPLCEKRYLRVAVQEAVRATVRSEDAALLRAATAKQDKEVVIAAIGGLGALGTSAQEDLRKLMEHKTAEISLAAARSLANQGDRTSLPWLVKLLDAEALEVRIGAGQTLRQVSDERHSFLAYEDASARAEAIERWDAWVKGEGLTAKLHFPLKRSRFELGHTLIAIYGQNKVIELDPSGKQVWEQNDLKQPWSCVGMPSGHRLISSYSGKFVVEYDASGKEVWRKDGLPASPFNVRRLENGNTLVACSDSHKVVEIQPDGKAVWDITINGRPMDARRLENGRTLVTLQTGGRVVEVDREGKVLWEITGLKNPITAQRLEDGSTLVAEVGGARVAEWDREGKVVWEHAGLKNPYSAQRLSNGNTLIVHGQDVREVDRQGKEIWIKKMTGVAHATRF